MKIKQILYLMSFCLLLSATTFAQQVQEFTVSGTVVDKTIVYKVVDGKAVSTLITVAGINDGREYVVLDGLKAGDEIVSEGAGLVREGTQVK